MATWLSRQWTSASLEQLGSYLGVKRTGSVAPSRISLTFDTPAADHLFMDLFVAPLGMQPDDQVTHEFALLGIQTSTSSKPINKEKPDPVPDPFLPPYR